MKTTWNRLSATIFDGDQKFGTVSVFFDYDLGSWVFGIHIEHDPCWYDVSFHLGPIEVSFMYWRDTSTLPSTDGTKP